MVHKYLTLVHSLALIGFAFSFIERSWSFSTGTEFLGSRQTTIVAAVVLTIMKLARFELYIVVGVSD